MAASSAGLPLASSSAAAFTASTPNGQVAITR
jgi:hypothetical protein